MNFNLSNFSKFYLLRVPIVLESPHSQSKNKQMKLLCVETLKKKSGKKSMYVSCIHQEF